MTTALVLANAGFRVTLFEKAEGFETLGAGIQLSPNATSVLQSLGLANKLRAVATQPSAIRIENGIVGWHLATIPLGEELQARHKNPYLLVHRADLQQILFTACDNHPSINIEFSSEIVEMAPHGRGVTISLAQSRNVSERLGATVVLADGIWSKLRTEVMHLPEPVYSGKIAWRAMFPANAVPDASFLEQTRVWFGPKSHVVTYPVRSRRQLNMVIIADGPKANEGERLVASSEEISKWFKWWRGSFRPLLKEQTRWTGWPLFEMPVPKQMHLSSIALAGDVAHAMLPFAAQGAAMAIEDAAVLGKCLSEHDTLDEALNTYSRLRVKRVGKVMKTARKNGRIYHMGLLTGLFRDMGMKLLPKKKLSDRQDWIYNWRP